MLKCATCGFLEPNHILPKILCVSVTSQSEVNAFQLPFHFQIKKNKAGVPVVPLEVCVSGTQNTTANVTDKIIKIVEIKKDVFFKYVITNRPNRIALPLIDQSKQKYKNNKMGKSVSVCE